MGVLISTKEILTRHLTVAANFDHNKILPYAQKEERKHIIPQITFAQYNTLIAHALDINSDLPIDRVKFLLEEASAFYSLLAAIPFLEIQITNFGINKATTSQSQPTDWKDIRDLKRYCLETANRAMDDALQIMEDNASDFNDWKTSDVFTVLKSNIVRHTNEFQGGFDINSNRKTFLSLQSTMKEVEEQYFLPMLGKPTLDFIKEVSADETVQRVQELCRLGVSALTVAKVAVTGKFLFTSTSFQIKTEELPWDKSKLELSEANQKALMEDRQNAGEEYLKKIKSIILANPTLFPLYEDNIEAGISTKTINKKSHFFL